MNEQAAPTASGEAPQPEKEAARPVVEPPPHTPYTPIIGQFEVSRASVKQSMAEAYHQAAQTDADMVAATQALERIRLSLLTERDVFKLWQRFDEAIVPLTQTPSGPHSSACAPGLRSSCSINSASVWKTCSHASSSSAGKSGCAFTPKDWHTGNSCAAEAW